MFRNLSFCESARISHSTKQGIISAKLGILAQEQGILPSTPEIIAADVFGTNNEVFFSYRWWGRLDPAPIPDKLRVHLSRPFNT
jgi:hypothetical protein